MRPLDERPPDERPPDEAHHGAYVGATLQQGQRSGGGMHDDQESVEMHLARDPVLGERLAGLIAEFGSERVLELLRRYRVGL